MYIVALVVFGIIVVIMLVTLAIYYLAFNKKTLITLNENGTQEIFKARKKKDRLYFNKNYYNVQIHNNYVKTGKKVIYFAQKIDEKTYVPYNPTGAKIEVSYSILNEIATNYEKANDRFKIGLEPFMPFITIAMVALFCVLGVAISMKFATDITPVEAEAISEFSDSMRTCSQYIKESQEINLELSQRLDIDGGEQEQEPPR